MYYIGMDIHNNYSSVAVIGEEGNLASRHRIDHRCREN
jgi:predicted NBD/HSP70 family sugar kinase